MGLTTKKTHEEFLKNFQEKQPDLFNSINVVEEYKGSSKHLLVETKYGKCFVKATHLLNGTTPTIMSAINKTEYFKNQLKITQAKLFDNIEILENYISSNKHILVKTKYGNCLSTPENLLNGSVPKIMSAVNKNEYFKAQAREVHGDLYDYSLVEYVNAFVKIKIISSKGIFEQTPADHLSGKGCSILGYLKISEYNKENPPGWSYTNWEKAALKSKSFDSFKVYIIKCWNNNEKFYKIGKTYTTVEKRFGSKRNMPYNYEITKEIKFDKTKEGSRLCCKTEKDLHIQFKNHKYTPLIKFRGMYECFEDIFNINLK